MASQQSTFDARTVISRFSHEMKDIKSKEPEEEILNGSLDRGRFHPILPQLQDLYLLYKKMQGCLWKAEAFHFSKDLPDFERLRSEERDFVLSVLAFFAESDNFVNVNIFERFSHDVKCLEARAFYSAQGYDETVHQETYSNAMDAYVKDPELKERLSNAIKTIPCIKRKADWMNLWTESVDAPFAVRLVAFAAVEGIMFSGSFCAIYWLRERNLMPEFCASNHDIARDEGLHTLFACALFKKLKNRPSTELIHALISQAVDIEVEFINDSISCSMIGMNRDLMKQYIQFVANRLLDMLGYTPIYYSDVDKTIPIRCPFNFMEKISMQVLGNFFEVPPEEYQLAGVMDHQGHHQFDVSDDF